MYQAILVDDEPFVLEGLVHAIDWEGYGFEIALAETNPLRALDYVQHNPAHLLITDVSMPQMSGIELMRQCKEVHPLLSVLVVSAYDRFAYVRDALTQGAENYLLKPVDPGELSESVGQLAGGMREREQLALQQAAGMQPFQTNFIESWLKDALAPGELRSRAALLGIDLDAGSYAAALFTAPEGKGAVLSRFYDLLLTSAKNKYTLHCCFETATRLACILTPRQAGRSLRGFVEKVLHRASIMDLAVSASVGETVASATLVYQSYRSAVALLFMQYSPQPCVLAEDVRVPPAALSVIERSLPQVPQRAYAQDLLDLFAPPEASPYVLCLAVMRWCARQHGSDTLDFFTRCPQFVRLARALPAMDASAAEGAAFCEEVVRESYRLLTGMQSTMHPCVEAVIAAVHEFSDKDISLKTLAGRLNVSPSYLGNAFRQHTGVYFNDYLTAARLNYAAELIVSTDMKMKDIVGKVGFSSQTYFNRTFKHQFALSPVAYRRMKKTAAGTPETI